MNKVQKLLPLLVVIVVALACANLPENRRGSQVSTNSSPSGAEPDSGWIYSQNQDEMVSGRVFIARIKSTNTISLEFPYAGDQHGMLVLREHPKLGKDVYLQIERGQLLSSDFNDPVVVRFDSEPAITFSSGGPSDHSTETLFLRGNAFAQFMNKLKSAKTVKIQVPLFQNGNQVFTFHVEGFNWKR